MIGTFVCLRAAFRGIYRAVSYIRRLITHRCVNKTTTSQQSLVPASLEETNGMDNYVVSMTACRPSLLPASLEETNGMDNSVVSMTASRPSLVPSSVKETYNERSSDEDKIEAIDEKTNDNSIAIEDTDGPDDLIHLFSVDRNNHKKRDDLNELEETR